MPSRNGEVPPSFILFIYKAHNSFYHPSLPSTNKPHATPLMDFSPPPPPKRRRLNAPSNHPSRMSTANILSLDDGAIHNIMNNLVQNVLKARSLKEAYSATSLLTTCTSLFQRSSSVFPQNIIEIDASFPISNADIVPNLTRHAAPEHLLYLVRQAAKYLKSLTLPLFSTHTQSTSVSHLLNAVAASTSGLEQLTFFDATHVTPFSLRNILQKCNLLRKLTVYQPSPQTLKVLATEHIQLQHISLLDINEAHLEYIKTFVLQKGNLLQSLSLGLFAEGKYSNYHYKHPETTTRPSVENLVHFLVCLGAEHFTNLTALNLKLPLNGYCEQCMHSFETQFHVFTNICNVQVELRRTTMVFPGDRQGDISFLKSVSLDMASLFLLHYSLDIFYGIEEVTIDSPQVGFLFQREAFHTFVTNAMLNTQSSLERFNIRYSFQNNSQKFQPALKFLSEIMSMDQAIKTFEVPSEIVALLPETDLTPYPHLCNGLENLEFLILNQSTNYGIKKTTCIEIEIIFQFVLNLPRFLDIIFQLCPRLQCLVVEKWKPVDASHALKQLEQIKKSVPRALQAVHQFETRNQQVDVGTLHAQLLLWK